MRPTLLSSVARTLPSRWMASMPPDSVGVVEKVAALEPESASQADAESACPSAAAAPPMLVSSV